MLSVHLPLTVFFHTLTHPGLGFVFRLILFRTMGKFPPLRQLSVHSQQIFCECNERTLENLLNRAVINSALLILPKLSAVQQQDM